MAKNLKKAGASKAAIEDGTEDPYLPKLTKVNFSKKPHCIYFYYVGIPIGKKKDRPVTHYYYTNGNNVIEKEELEDKIKLLIDNARDKNPHPSIPIYGYDWKGMVWTRRSYIVIFIDDIGVEFKVDARRREVHALNFDTVYGMDNHTFFDAHQKYIEDRPTIWFVNHMKKRKQTTGNVADLETETQHFRFKLELNGLVEELDDRYPDSGGTNMGPAVPP